MLLSHDGLAATLFVPFRVKLLLLHARETLHLSNGSPFGSDNIGRDGLPKLSTSVVAQPEMQATD